MRSKRKKDTLRRFLTRNVIWDILAAIFFVGSVLTLFFLCSSCKKEELVNIPMIEFNIEANSLNNFNLEIYKNNTLTLKKDCNYYNENITIKEKENVTIKMFSKGEISLSIKRVNFLTKTFLSKDSLIKTINVNKGIEIFNIR